MLKFMLMLWLLMIWIVIFELLGSMIGWFDSVCGVIGMSMMFVSCGWRIGLVDDSVYVVELVGVVMISLFECWLYMQWLLIDVCSLIILEKLLWFMMMLLKVSVWQIGLLLCMICVLSSECFLCLNLLVSIMGMSVCMLDVVMLVMKLSCLWLILISGVWYGVSWWLMLSIVLLLLSMIVMFVCVLILVGVSVGQLVMLIFCVVLFLKMILKLSVVMLFVSVVSGLVMLGVLFWLMSVIVLN